MPRGAPHRGLVRHLLDAGRSGRPRWQAIALPPRPGAAAATDTQLGIRDDEPDRADVLTDDVAGLRVLVVEVQRLAVPLQLLRAVLAGAERQLAGHAGRADRITRDGEGRPVRGARV